MTARTKMAATAGARRRRGTALVETALCIPLLALALALTLFLGWAMMNQQGVKSAVRYTAWRNVYRSRYELGYDPNDPNNVESPTPEALNRKFFRDEGTDIDIGGGNGTIEEMEQLVQAAGQYSGAAESLSAELLIYRTYWGGFHRAQRSAISSEFETQAEALQRYEGDIRSEHMRDGVEWRRHQADCRRAIREQFLLPLHTVLDGVDAPGDGMARMIQGLYKHGW